VVFLPLFILSASQPLLSQSLDLIFQHYTADQGLSQNMVDCILKDSRGFMWFGTWNGLNRFDGYEFDVYKYNPLDTNTINNNFIQTLCEDTYGNIWVGTQSGLNIYIFNQNRFVRLSDKQKTPNTFFNDISYIMKDHEGKIWIASDQGIKVLEIIDGQGRYQISKNYSELKKFENTNIFTLFEKGDSIWIGAENGLYLYYKGKGNIDTLYTDFEEFTNLFANSISSIHIDNKNILWVGLSGYGLIKYNLSDETLNYYINEPDNDNSLVHNTVQDITEDKQGNLLIGTLGGISIYNRFTNDFNNYTFESNNKFSLNNNFVNSLYADADGNVWIGTERGGINKYNVFKKKFESLSYEIGNPNSLSHNTINSIYDNGKYLWIGTAGGGLNLYNKEEDKFMVFRNNPNNISTLSNDFITTVFRDSKSNLWVGNWGGGLHMIKSGDEEKGNFVHFFNEESNPFSLVNDFISSIVEDANGRLWFGTLGGLDVYFPERRIFYHLKNPEYQTPLNEVGCLQFDANGNLWIGTIHGLYMIKSNDKGIIDLSELDISIYNTDETKENSISSNYVISILSDSNNNLWFGTYGNGFNKLTSNIGSGNLTFKKYTEEDGLSNNIVFGILDDDHGNLWLSTENGLSKFNTKEKTFKNYYVSDGLLSNQFYWSAAHKNKNGKMFFGGMQGLNMFYPDSIIDNNVPPKVILTELKIYSQPVEVGVEYDGIKVLDKSISSTKRLALSHKSREFTIEFSALHYDQPGKNRYKYRLDNFDEEGQWNWVDASRRFATYSNLEGGEYIFKLMASNNDDIWSDQPLELVINIKPPFWKTWLFKILVAIIITSFTFTYIRIRLYSLKKQKINLEAKVKSRTAKIEEQKEELESMTENLLEANKLLEKKNEKIEDQKRKVEIQNEEILEHRDRLIAMNKKVQSANQHRIQFFTNISHEFRTPLTLIISPLEQLVEQTDLGYIIKQKLQLMYKNARRMLNLINQLMELRKVETGKLDLMASKEDIVLFVTNISKSFHELSFKRNLNFYVETEHENIITYFDHDKIENIVYNLLSNAFKYTPEGGSVNLELSLKDGHEISKNYFQAIVEKTSYLKKDYQKYVEIMVSDSGIGVDPSHLQEIFKMFYRDPSIEGTHIHGTGIGLSLVKELVKAHRGLLYVKSEKGKGSVFKVLIPYGDSFLLPEEKVESSTDPEWALNKIKTETLKTDIKDRSSVTEKDLTQYHHPQVLIVEDNADMRSYVATELQKNFRILEAVNGKEGIEMASVHSPDIIISDIMMPEIDGLELCARVKSDIATSHIPVILLTSKAGVKDHIEGFESGADAYIPKPFNISILESRIQNILKNRNNLRKLFIERVVPEPKKLTSNTIDEKFLKNAIKIVNDNFHRPEFTVEIFASEMNASRSLLHKKLVAIVGNSPIDFITSIRMKKAVSLLLNSSDNINEVAYKVGFNDPKYFSRCFKKHYGKTPTEFLKEH